MRLAARSRMLALSYILFMFFGLPLLLLALTGTFGGDKAPADPATGSAAAAATQSTVSSEDH